MSTNRKSIVESKERLRILQQHAIEFKSINASVTGYISKSKQLVNRLTRQQQILLASVLSIIDDIPSLSLLLLSPLKYDEHKMKENVQLLENIEKSLTSIARYIIGTLNFFSKRCCIIVTLFSKTTLYSQIIYHEVSCEVFSVSSKVIQ